MRGFDELLPVGLAQMEAIKILPLHTRILIGLIIGAAAGAGANALAGGSAALERAVTWVAEPAGKIWLSALIMMVIPLILSTVSLGVVGLGNLRRLGRIGAATLLSFLGLTALSASVGLSLMGLIEPGRGLDPSIKTGLLEAYGGQATEAMGLSGTSLSIDLLVRIVPRNPVQAAASGDMLAVIFFSLVLGVALASIGRSRSEPLERLLDSLGQVCLAVIGMAMKLAPLGVFCLSFSVTARFGFEILTSLVWYVLTIVSGLAVVLLVAYPVILRLVAGRSPIEFFREGRLVLVTAFSTSSSAATLPTTLQVATERLGLPAQVAGFVIPLGATINMNGTALFEGGTVLFLAQVFGVDLPLGAQLVVVLMSVMTAIGTAAVPGGSIPLLIMVLRMVGVPVEGIAIVMGVDRILDMCRSAINVMGDMVTTAVVTRLAGGGLSASKGSPPPASAAAAD